MWGATSLRSSSIYSVGCDGLGAWRRHRTDQPKNLRRIARHLEPKTKTMFYKIESEPDLQKRPRGDIRLGLNGWDNDLVTTFWPQNQFRLTAQKTLSVAESRYRYKSTYVLHCNFICVQHYIAMGRQQVNHVLNDSPDVICFYFGSVR